MARIFRELRTVPFVALVNKAAPDKKVMTRRRPCLRTWWAFSIAMIVLAAVGRPAQAQFVWNNAAGGIFANGANWTPAGPPVAGQTATFNLAANYTVTFDANAASGALTTSTGNVVFVSSGATRTYNVTSVVVSSGSLTLGSSPINLVGTSSVNLNGAGATLNVQSGSTLSASIFSLASNNTAALNVTGAGSSFTGTGTASTNDVSRGTVTFSNSASGILNANLGVNTQTGGGIGIFNVQSGATVTANRGVIIGGASGGAVSGAITVDGAGTTMANANASFGLTVGGISGSTGTLTVQNSGTYSTSTAISTINATGAINLTTGFFNLFGDLNINTGIFNQSLGTLNIASGRTITLTTGGDFTSGAGFTNSASGSTIVSGAGSTFVVTSGACNIGSGSLFQVTSGGALTIGSSLGVGTAGGNGTLTVTGAGSSFAGGSNPFTIGQSGFTGTATFTVDAAGSSGNLFVGSTSTANTVGTMNVLAGADYSASSLVSIGDVPGTSVGGALTVQGAGSTFTQSGSAAITVGATAQSVGTLNVDSGAVFTTGTGLLSVNATGTINVNSATLTSNSSTVDVRGQLLAANGTLTLASNSTTTVFSGGTMTAGTLALPANSQFRILGGNATVSALTLGATSATTLTGGTLSVNSLTMGGGTFTWNHGTLAYQNAATFDSSNLPTLLGASNALTAGRTLTVANAATLNTQLNVAGGTFSVGSIVNAPLLNFTSGTVNLTASGLTVGSAGLFGSTLDLATGKTLTVSGTTTVNAGSLLRSSGGSFTSTSGIVNNGTVQMASDVGTIYGGTLTNSGVVRGTGYIGNVLANQTAGQVQMTTGNRLEFGGSGNTNAGTINAVGGEVQFNGSMTNSTSTGLIAGRDAIYRFNGGLTNNQSLAFSNGTMDVYGNIASTRFVNASDRSRITVSGGGLANFYGDVTVGVGQTDIQVSAAGSTVSKAVFFGNYNGGSTGGGQVFIEGDHRPGASPGFAHFVGDAFYGSAASLHMEIGGLTRGIQYDSIDVSNILGLAGTLDVDLINGFIPNVGQEFTVATYGSRQGNFEHFLDMVYSFGKFVPRYAGNSLVLRFMPVHVGNIFDANDIGIGPSDTIGGFGGNFGPVPEPTSILLACAATVLAFKIRGRCFTTAKTGS